MSYTGKALEDLLKKYCIDHSSRRINFLYWNTTDPKDMTLNFVNLTGKELNRINNSDLVYRIVRVKNVTDWQALVAFFNTYIVDPNEPKVAYVVRVDYLMGYLKTIKFDTAQINFSKGPFGALYFDQPIKGPNGENVMQRRHVAVIDTDIQSLYLIDKLYTKYRKPLFSDDADWKIHDITQDYLQSSDFKFVVEELGISVAAVDSLDIVAKKYIERCRTVDPNCRLEQIYMQNGLSTIANRMICSEMNILTVRVFIQLFLKKYSKKGK